MKARRYPVPHEVTDERSPLFLPSTFISGNPLQEKVDKVLSAIRR
jgi:hypothetical protein